MTEAELGFLPLSNSETSAVSLPTPHPQISDLSLAGAMFKDFLLITYVEKHEPIYLRKVTLMRNIHIWEVD